ncbi:hypothetical protein EV421DRAFT_1912145 [Armillaria borealis]|uniref:Uncharacterized protein n=1 Tax=Armillaria borealis TaxID=47425 RepID=A0AA39IVC1_9AGAR|nr:hypothetical protein EV421DRAFT_1912145 [Armillaria borealis]
MSVVESNIDEQSDTMVLHMWCHDSHVNNISKAVNKVAHDISANHPPDRATVDHIVETLCTLNGEYIFENGLDHLWANRGGDKLTLFQEEYARKRKVGLEPFLLWDTHWKAFFSSVDVAFETEVKQWLPSSEWVILVASQMGFLAYFHLDGHILGPADLSNWSVWPVAVKELCQGCLEHTLSCQYTGHESTGPCRACVLTDDKCVSSTVSDCANAELFNLTDLMFAADTIIRDNISLVQERETRSLASMGLYANATMDLVWAGFSELRNSLTWVPAEEVENGSSVYT